MPRQSSLYGDSVEKVGLSFNGRVYASEIEILNRRGDIWTRISRSSVLKKPHSPISFWQFEKSDFSIESARSGRLRSENARLEANTHSRCPLEVRPSFVRRPGKAVQRLVTGGNVDVHGLRAHSSHLFQITGVHRLNRRVDDRGGIGDAPRSATLSAGRCSCRFAGRFHACSASRRSRCPARWPRSASNCLLRVPVPQSFLLSGSRRAPLAPSVS